MTLSSTTSCTLESLFSFMKYINVLLRLLIWCKYFTTNITLKWLISQIYPFDWTSSHNKSHNRSIWMAFYLHELLKYGWSGFFYFYKRNQKMSKKWPHEQTRQSLYHKEDIYGVFFLHVLLWSVFPSDLLFIWIFHICCIGRVFSIMNISNVGFCFLNVFEIFQTFNLTSYKPHKVVMDWN